jgi:hypothetical protein
VQARVVIRFAHAGERSAGVHHACSLRAR